jgi:hypothetical protein
MRRLSPFNFNQENDIKPSTFKEVRKDQKGDLMQETPKINRYDLHISTINNANLPFSGYNTNAL